MNKRFAWELFKNTGNIDAYMLMKDVEYSEQMPSVENSLEKPVSDIGDTDGNYKNKRDSY